MCESQISSFSRNVIRNDYNLDSVRRIGTACKGRTHLSSSYYVCANKSSLIDQIK